jgi:hypothetical protein
LFSISEKNNEDKIRITNAATLMFEKKYDFEKLSKRFYIFEREQNLEIYQDVIVSSEESIANES